MAVQAHDEIEVLDHARRAVPADRVEVFLAEQAECARDDEAAPQPVPAESAEQEGAQVFDHLRSEEHTSELQSQSNLVCRLLLEKKNKKNNNEKVCSDPFD